MRYVLLRDAVPGMVLGQELYDSYGRVLIGNNNLLTEVYIEKLEQYGFDGVYIEDELSEGIVLEPMISPKLRVKGQECIRTCNIDGCLTVAKDIVKEIVEHGKISMDLADLRTYDDYTYAHSVNVAVISGVIGMGMKMCEEDLEILVTAALLHDLGKLFIPPEILNKPSRLTPEEYQIMKTHPLKSYDLIRERWDISAKVKTAVLFHHKNMDGSGYPEEIIGEDQTIYVKILHVADVYDALISKRPYKSPYSPYEATEYLMAECDTLFDKQVVETLLQYVPFYPKGTEVKLSNGQRGIIFENGGAYNLRPVVRLLDGNMLDLTEGKNLSLTLTPLQKNYVSFSESYERQRDKMIGKTGA